MLENTPAVISAQDFVGGDLAAFAESLADDLGNYDKWNQSSAVVGGFANAIFGAIIFPVIVQKLDRGMPPDVLVYMLGAAIGGLLGAKFPLATTVVQGVAAASILDLY